LLKQKKPNKNSKNLEFQNVIIEFQLPSQKFFLFSELKFQSPFDFDQGGTSLDIYGNPSPM